MNELMMTGSMYSPDDPDYWKDPFGNETINAINRLPVMPRSARGFGQWAAIVGAAISAAGQIGSSAITATLAPTPKTTVVQQAAAPVAAVKPAPSAATDYAPWLIGGGIAFAALLIIILTMRSKSK